MILYKQGVCGDLNNQVQKALGRLGTAYERNGEDLVVTSIRDGNHGMGSLHYIGDAFDCRFPTTNKLTKDQIKDIVGPGFDVVIEHNHLHIEWDPDN